MSTALMVTTEKAAARTAILELTSPEHQFQSTIEGTIALQPTTITYSTWF